MESNGNGVSGIGRLKNEFASVELSIDQRGNGPRLRVMDLRSGRANYFDPLEIEALAWAASEQVEPLLDPGRTRWASVTDDVSDRQDDRTDARPVVELRSDDVDRPSKGSCR